MIESRLWAPWQTVPVPVPNTRVSQLMGLLAASTALAMVSWWVLSAYFNVSIPESIAWFVRDGDCRPIALQGMVPHCWQDYSQFIGLDGMMIGPDDNQFILNYPPISRLVFRLFEILGELTTTGFALGAFLILNLAGMLSPSFWATKGRPWDQRVLVMSLLGIATLPTLATLDRGNNLGLIVPVLAAFLYGLIRGNYRLATVMIIVAAQFKPQFLVLVFALMAIRQWRRSFEAIGGTLVVFLLSFLMFGTRAVQQAYLFVEYLVKFNGYQPLDAGYPPNISFGRAFQVAFATITRVLPSDLAAAVMDVWLQYRAPALLGIGFAVLASLTCIKLGPRIPVFAVGAIALVIAACFPGITNAYYSAVAIVIGSVIVALNDVPSARRSIGALMIVAVSLSLSMIVIPYGFRKIADSAQVVAFDLTPILATATWMTVIVVTLWSAARQASPDRELVK